MPFGENTLFVPTNAILAAGPPWKAEPPVGNIYVPTTNENCYANFDVRLIEAPGPDGTEISSFASNAFKGDLVFTDSVNSVPPDWYGELAGDNNQAYLYSAANDYHHLSDEAGAGVFKSDTQTFAFVLSLARNTGDVTLSFSGEDGFTISIRLTSDAGTQRIFVNRGVDAFVDVSAAMNDTQTSPPSSQLVVVIADGVNTYIHMNGYDVTNPDPTAHGAGDVSLGSIMLDEGFSGFNDDTYFQHAIAYDVAYNDADFLNRVTRSASSNYGVTVNPTPYS